MVHPSPGTVVGYPCNFYFSNTWFYFFFDSVKVAQNFQMPGAGMPNFRRNGVLMAKHGIYDLRQHLEEVVMPVLRKWNIFERTDFTARGEEVRESLGKFLENLEGQATKFEEQRDRMLAREAKKREQKAS